MKKIGMDKLTIIAILSLFYNLLHMIGFVPISNHVLDQFMVSIASLFILLGILNPNSGGLGHDDTDGEA